MPCELVARRGSKVFALSIVRLRAPNSFLLLVVWPGAPSSFLLLAAMPGAPSSVLAPSCETQNCSLLLTDSSAARGGMTRESAERDGGEIESVKYIDLARLSFKGLVPIGVLIYT